MKIKALRMLAIARQWASTKKGEHTIVQVLNTLTIVLILDIVLLIFG